MKERIGKINIKDLKIKTKRDWVIFWIFAVLVAYIAGDEFNGRINQWLRGYGNPWLTDLNEPTEYGRLIVAALILAVVAEFVLFWCHKSTRAKLIVVFIGILSPILLIGVYQLHCKLIVSVLWEEEPRTIRVVCQDTEEYLKFSGENVENTISSDACQEVLELCRNLTFVSDEEQKAGMEWYHNAESPFLGTDMIALYFPEKYGHSYTFTLRLHEGHVYLWRGYSEDDLEVTFFEDNGVTAWLNELRKDATQAAE